MGIKTIVNSDGLRVHVGNTVDTKFQSILAQSGNIAVDANCKFEKGRWDGSKWVKVLPTALEIWEEAMETADREHGLPRYAEDILDGMPDKSGVAQITLGRLQSKKNLRATKP
jgi:hypothetical protein